MKIHSVALCLAAFGVSSLSAATVYRELPDDYVQVEYIESTGAQYLKTGVNADASVSAVLDFTPLEYTGDVTIGLNMSDDDHDWRFFNYNGGSMFDIGQARIGMNDSTKLSNGTRYTVEIGNAYLRILNEDGSAKWSGEGGAQGDGNITSGEIWLCATHAANDAAKNFVRMRVHAVKLSRAGELVCDLVPCYRVSDGEPGLYDVVSSAFVTDAAAASAKFTLGEEVPIPGYLLGDAVVKSVTDVTPGEANVKVVVRDLSSYSGPVALRLVYGYNPSSMPFSKDLTDSAEVGAYDCTLLGLTPKTQWFVAVKLVPASGEPYLSSAKAFTTTSDGMITEGGSPGLSQGYRSGNWTPPGGSEISFATCFCDYAADDAEGPWTSRATVSGTLLAFTTGSVSENGATYQWRGSDAVAYQGYMRLVAGTTYRFSKSLDDGYYFKIDDGDWHFNGGYGDFVHVDFACESSGWYPVDIRFYNGSGGAGPFGSNMVVDGAAIGFGYRTSTDGGATWGAYAKVQDPGDGSLLRTALYVDAPVVADGWTYSDGVFSGAVTCPSLPEGGELRLYAARLNGGADTNAWTLVMTTAIAASDSGQSVAFDSVALPADALLVRFLLSDESTDTMTWGETVSMELAVAPSVSNRAISDLTGTSVTLNGTLAGLGVEGACAVSAILAPTNQLGTSVYSTSLSALGDFSFAVADLLPGTTYSVYFKAVNADGFEGASPSFSFATPAGSKVTSHSVAADDRSATVTAKLSVGAGATTATLYFGPVDGELTAYEVQFDADGTIAKTFENLGYGISYSYRIVIENAETSAAGAAYSWSDDTGLQTKAVTIYDVSTYTWKGAAGGGVDAGAWEVAANWTSSADDPEDRVGYPTDNSTVVFEGAGPYEVTLAKSVSVAKFYQRAGCDLTVKGPSRDTVLYMKDHDFATGTILRTVGLKVSERAVPGRVDQYVSGAGYLELRGEYFSSFDGALYSIAEGSEFYTGSENYPGGGGYNFIVDDSTATFNRIFYHSDRETGNSLITIRGRSPYVVGGMFIARGTYRGNLVFEIPEGGYDRQPCVYSGGGEGFMGDGLWGSSITTGVNVAVSPQSPVLKKPGKFDVKLVESGSRRFGFCDGRPMIYFDNAAQPRGSYFYFADKNGEALTDASGAVLEGRDLTDARQLWCHVSCQGMTVIVR